MMDKEGNDASSSTLDLRGQTTATECGQTFWNTSTVEMKFSTERSWIKSVRKAKKQAKVQHDKYGSSS